MGGWGEEEGDIEGCCCCVVRHHLLLYLLIILILNVHVVQQVIITSSCMILFAKRLVVKQVTFVGNLVRSLGVCTGHFH